jgi:hypothetical protein
MARFLEMSNSTYLSNLFLDARKGFISGIDESFARKKETSIIATQIGCSHAFGSVPHNLFLSNLTLIGVAADFVGLAQDL